MRAALSGDVIVHLAAVHRDDVRDPALYAQTNVEGTRNLCQVAGETGVDKIVFTSSVAVYGFAEPGTDEAGAINPFNEYGRTKFEAEEVLRDWQAAEDGQRSLIIVRPTVVFGEGNRGNVFNLLNQIASGRFLMVGSGTNRKSMAYVGNIAAFLQHALTADCHYGMFNYVDDPDFDMNTLVAEVRGTLTGAKGVGPRLPYAVGLAMGHAADLVARLTKRNLPLSAIRVKKFCGTTSFASAKGTLDGFVPPYSLKDGLRRTLEAEFLSPDPDREIFFTE
ncbi:NAD-dependent epimerase/dehydratase family protein [Acidimangrovimonas pyrenivorans]|uniref:NAD-dependent epimerase/dehydratase family protein n=1 Tax=Acidimangrovimonas pyrenivorans TaxID=2030798 RepID=UPI00367057B5